MTTHVEVQMSLGGRWRPAELTDERHYRHPVVVLAGEHEVRGPSEVLFIRPLIGTDRELLEAAKLAGYEVVEAHTDQPYADATP